MKSSVILIFSCLFTSFLATAAQASGFTGNTCYEEGANCQTQSDWMIGWCEAAVAAGAVDQTAEECAQSVGANHPNMQVAPTQNENTRGSASISGQSGGGQGQGANQTKNPVALTQSPNPNNSEQSNGGAREQGSGNGDASDGRPVNCRAWIVRRSNPSLFNCFRVTRRGIGGEFLIDG